MTLIDKAEARWPVRGYAPGAYSCKCRKCGQAFIGDKRAYQCQDCVIQDLAALPARGVGAQERVQHKKRGSTYRIVGRGKVQTDTPLTDYAEVVVYQCEDDGTVWVRPVSEFEDGRFAALAPTDAAQDDDPECTDCGGTGITYQTERRCSCQPTDASQAREAALREAAAAVRARYMGDNNREDQEVLRCEAAILAMIEETRA